jgi:hypothetical protein
LKTLLRPKKGGTKTAPELLQGGTREDPKVVTALLLYDTSTVHELAATRTTFTVGAAPDRDIAIHSPFVSARHCRLDRKLLGLRVKDQGSRNGTYFDGEGGMKAFYLRPGKTFVVGALPHRLLALNDDMRAYYPELLDILGAPETHVLRGETPSPGDMILAAVNNGHILITSEPHREQARLAQIIHGLSKARARPIIECNSDQVPADPAKQLELVEKAARSTLVLNLGDDDTRLASNFVTTVFASKYRVRVIVLTRGVAVANKALGEYARRLQYVWLPPISNRPEEIDRLLDRMFVERNSSLRVSNMPPDDQSALRAYGWPDDFASLREAADILAAINRLGSLPKAARELKIAPSTLYHWYVEKLGLALPPRK